MLRFGGGGDGRCIFWLCGGSRAKLREAGSVGGSILTAVVTLAGFSGADLLFEGGLSTDTAAGDC